MTEIGDSVRVSNLSTLILAHIWSLGLEELTSASECISQIRMALICMFLRWFNSNSFKERLIRAQRDAICSTTPGLASWLILHENSDRLFIV
jgi:hypothetical protein